MIELVSTTERTQLLDPTGKPWEQVIEHRVDPLTGTVATLNAALGRRRRPSSARRTWSSSARSARARAPSDEIRDAFGNLTNSTGSVALTLAGGPTGATPSGTTVVSAVAGVATFPASRSTGPARATSCSRPRSRSDRRPPPRARSSPAR